MKVLISAFACGPGRGSEPGIGWNWLREASRKHEVWVLTLGEHKAEIDREAPSNVHVTFIPSPQMWRKLQTSGIPGLGWLYYYWWQLKAYRVGQRLHSQVGFDLV